MSCSLQKGKLQPDSPQKVVSWIAHVSLSFACS